MADEEELTEVCYDAFVIYNPEDLDQLNFVKEMADILEGQEHNLRLFIPWRDDLQQSDFNFIIKPHTVKKKCRRVIVVLSHSFINSAAADFQFNFYLSLSQGSRNECIIPLLIDQCPVPPSLDLLNTAIFYKEGLRDWQWLRVAANLKYEPVHPLAERLCPDIDTNEGSLDTSNETHRQWWKNVKSLTLQKNKEKPKEVQTTSGAENQSVIPLLNDQCPLTPFLDHLNTTTFYNEGLCGWQWLRVAADLKNELVHPLAERSCPDIDTNEGVLDTSNETHRQWWENVKSLTLQKNKEKPKEIQPTSESMKVDDEGLESDKMKRKTKYRRWRPVKRMFNGIFKKVCACWK